MVEDIKVICKEFDDSNITKEVKIDCEELNKKYVTREEFNKLLDSILKLIKPLNDKEK